MESLCMKLYNCKKMQDVVAKAEKHTQKQKQKQMPKESKEPKETKDTMSLQPTTTCYGCYSINNMHIAAIEPVDDDFVAASNAYQNLKTKLSASDKDAHIKAAAWMWYMRGKGYASCCVPPPPPEFGHHSLKVTRRKESRFKLEAKLVNHILDDPSFSFMDCSPHSSPFNEYSSCEMSPSIHASDSFHVPKSLSSRLNLTLSSTPSIASPALPRKSSCQDQFLSLHENPVFSSQEDASKETSTTTSNGCEVEDEAMSLNQQNDLDDDRKPKMCENNNVRQKPSSRIFLIPTTICTQFPDWTYFSDVLRTFKKKVISVNTTLYKLSHHQKTPVKCGENQTINQYHHHFHLHHHHYHYHDHHHDHHHE